MESKPPFPPFNLETATAKVQGAEDAWNTRNPEKVALAYTVDSQWRNRAEFINGREEITAFLRRKWAKELDYRLKKRLWSFRENRISVCFEYEWHDDGGFWYRAYGNENWEFAENADEFAEKITRALEGQAPSLDARLAAAQEKTYRVRTRRMMELVEK